MKKLLGMMLLLAGTAVVAMAQMGPPPPLAGTAPEINPSEATAVVAFISGGLLVLRARRRKS